MKYGIEDGVRFFTMEEVRPPRAESVKALITAARVPRRLFEQTRPFILPPSPGS